MWWPSVGDWWQYWHVTVCGEVAGCSKATHFSLTTLMKIIKALEGYSRNVCLDTTRTTAIYLIAWWGMLKNIIITVKVGQSNSTSILWLQAAPWWPRTTAAHFSGFGAGPYLEYLMSTSWSSLSLPSLAPRRILFFRRSFAIITSTLAAICCSTSVLANTFAAASFGEHVSRTSSHYPLTLHPSPWPLA